MINKIKNWSIDPSCTTSDLNLIIFEVEEGPTVRKFLKKEKRYNVKKADWENFYKEINKEFEEDKIKPLEDLPADDAVKKFNKMLEHCCAKAIPKLKTGQSLVPWWSDELGEWR